MPARSLMMRLHRIKCQSGGLAAGGVGGMSIDALPELLQQLDHIPIERLGLSDKALSVLKWHGITNLLTCIVFFYHDAHHTSHDWSKLVAFMYDEVEPNMKIHGY